ncbi:unnamed protein product [Aspergillus oryzae]|uniref:Unnamed protein product n=1 Tax=Aspergillus oryzae var. brunneus TaxID=332754 RepID=A0ABQ6KGD2_ASPOZ|nr:unnamed protein product [Aspergillus oryzae]GMF83990.1 unnamed protein product [Aspergillus oryzae]GMG42542.1 unnamed protein product [Aspergillus oryzae var. brunneus]
MGVSIWMCPKLINFSPVQAFAAAFSAYWLIKWLPFWGLSLIAVTIAYIGPLVYMNNREVIDAQIENIQEVVNSQAHQLKDLAEERTSHATGLMKQYVDDYSAKAQEYIGQRRSVSPQMTKVSTPEPVIKKEIDTEPVFKTTDFPEAPKEEPVAVKEEPVAVAESIEHPALNAEKEPLLAA